MTDIATAARRASDNPTMDVLARFGLMARALVYVIVGWLAVEIARGHSQREANQRGALAEVAHHSFGVVLLWALGLGFAAYAVWRLTSAAFGSTADDKKAGSRLRDLVRGIVYAAFSVSTFSFIAGKSKQGQSQQQATLTARFMRDQYGRWLVGLVGLIIVLVGLGLIVEGVTKKFEKQLRMYELRGLVRTVVVGLGIVGNVARGIAFALAGVLVVDAAVTFNPGKSTGLDGALRSLADRPYGPWLLGVVALGLIAFGLFGFASARWAKT
jgi:hypothetical protein